MSLFRTPSSLISGFEVPILLNNWGVYWEMERISTSHVQLFHTWCMCSRGKVIEWDMTDLLYSPLVHRAAPLLGYTEVPWLWGQVWWMKMGSPSEKTKQCQWIMRTNQGGRAPHVKVWLVLNVEGSGQINHYTRTWWMKRWCHKRLVNSVHGLWGQIKEVGYHM